jgi:hypothetical protein
MATLKEATNIELLEEVRERLQNEQLIMDGAFLSTNNEKGINTNIYLGQNFEERILESFETAFQAIARRGLVGRTRVRQVRRVVLGEESEN